MLFRYRHTAAGPCGVLRWGVGGYQERGESYTQRSKLPASMVPSSYLARTYLVASSFRNQTCLHLILSRPPLNLSAPVFRCQKCSHLRSASNVFLCSGSALRGPDLVLSAGSDNTNDTGNPTP
eukprot:1290519-Rhodomonas_salina.1